MDTTSKQVCFFWPCCMRRHTSVHAAQPITEPEFALILSIVALIIFLRQRSHGMALLLSTVTSVFAMAKRDLQ